MNERIKELRKYLELNQTEFGSKIGVSRDTIANIEGNRIEVKDVIMLAICREFNIRKEWLLTGKGEMFAKDREVELARLTKTLLQEEPDSFKNRLISALAKLNEDQWELLAQISEEITKE